MKRLKLMIVSHAMVQEVCQKRWRLFSERYLVDVTVVVPRVWQSVWLKKKWVFRPRPVREENYRVLTFPATTTRFWGKYLFYSLDMGLREVQPDVIYVVQEEMLWIQQQVITLRRRWAPGAKMMFFSMNALGVPAARPDQRWRWERVRQNHDAALGHYPGCLKSLKDAGFNKPMFMQTQVGVDETLYAPDPRDREIMRGQLGLQDHFVIGYAGRLIRDKGVDVLLQALDSVRGNWKLLLAGGGDYEEHIRNFFHERGWDDRLVFAGAVAQTEVARHLRAMDCFAIGSRTRPYWLDTFPNSLVQAMSCGVAVVGSDSAAIPHIIQDAGLIVREGDAPALADALNLYIRDQGQREAYGRRARERAVRLAGLEAINENFFDIIQQVMSGRYKFDLPDTDQRKAWL